jgi:CBS domain-containing protein
VILGMKVKEVMTENPIVAELPGTRTEVLKKLVKNNVTRDSPRHADDWTQREREGRCEADG